MNINDLLAEIESYNIPQRNIDNFHYNVGNASYHLEIFLGVQDYKGKGQILEYMYQVMTESLLEDLAIAKETQTLGEINIGKYSEEKVVDFISDLSKTFMECMPKSARLYISPTGELRKGYRYGDSDAQRYTKGL